jgi:hypothetical protein
VTMPIYVNSPIKIKNFFIMQYKMKYVEIQIIEIKKATT